jgi:cellulose synthase/poly-beta-1,6-N-acetylglucosamine synthase-like glycosyltransferase
MPPCRPAADYALSMELAAVGLRGRYLPEVLAIGEAPETVRNIFQQRSRWCKGHFQASGVLCMCELNSVCVCGGVGGCKGR